LKAFREKNDQTHEQPKQNDCGVITRVQDSIKQSRSALSNVSRSMVSGLKL